MRTYFESIRIRYADHPYFLYPYLLLIPAAVFLPFVWVFMMGLLLVLATLWHLHNLRRDDQQHHQQQIQALIGMHQRHAFREPLPLLGGFTADPVFLVRVEMLMRAKRPASVVEFGAGVSTVFWPYVLREWGGALRAFDHEEVYGSITRGRLAQHGWPADLLRIAPLGAVQVHGQTRKWYAISPGDLPDRIDFLIVDGPPEQSTPLARYPALPVLRDRLAPGAVIILDDADRPDERAMVRLWLKEFPGSTVRYEPGAKGFAVFTLAQTRSEKA